MGRSVLTRRVIGDHQGSSWLQMQKLKIAVRIPDQQGLTGGMASLTPREQQILWLVAEGMRNGEISDELNVTEHTIRNSISHMFDKLGMSSRIELVLYTLSR